MQNSSKFALKFVHEFSILYLIMANRYLKRRIDKELVLWKNDKEHKLLLLRGARQVGKSRSVRKLAELFEHFVEINFEKNKKVHKLFDGDLDAYEICEKLSALLKKPIIPKKTLVFFDEIQSCPNAISALRFFYEDYPELHVIAAGSLLEFALEELPSFGVGRIRSVFMYPLSFAEFMDACGEDLLWKEVCLSSPDKPLFEPFHEKCLEYLKKFLLLGGMPAVVAKYTENKNILECQKILNDLITSLKADFSKYKKRVPNLQILKAFEAVVNQNGNRFNYSNVEQLNYRQIKDSLELLQKAGLVISVVHSSSNGLPLGSKVNFKKQKFILLDTGIFQRLLGLELSDILLNNDISVINKGAIAEQYAGLEFLKSASCYEMQENLYFWSREKEKSNAEVDYVIQRGENIIPVEIKSGSSGKMQSMHIFISEKNSEYGIRSSLENFSFYEKIKVWPLYAIGNA
uniref:Putative ATPase (AAA+ superfamily) n=1 Tax=uncultured bacterium contig00029 TaxID=1181518 RepID=A0A806JYP6_9BACT|nr:putative ATPase (AAA+ superfamily) [uncultured bacterium contig00029]